MRPTTKSTLKRFARGLAYTVGGSAVAYALANIGMVADVAPRYSILVPVISAGLLAADKWFRARGYADQA